MEDNTTHTAGDNKIIYETMKDPREFPVRPVEDWIIVEKIKIKSKTEKIMDDQDIQRAHGKTPKNIMDIERMKANEIASYDDAEDKVLSDWEEHPFQGTVKAVGPGRSIEEGVIIPVPVKVGDQVMTRKMAGEVVVINKKVYWMHKPHEIYAVYRK